MASKPSGGEQLLDDLFAIFKATPWWIGPITIATTFAAFRWVIPWLFQLFEGDPETSITISVILDPLSRMIAPIFAALVTIVWLGALFGKFTDAQRLDKQRDPDTIRDLSWREFEQLLAEAFRRQGYRVTDTGQTHGTAQPDGGIDLVLHGSDTANFRGTTLVQCKHWKAWQVGVKTARELYGVVASQHADRGVLITSGRFTQPAQDFAQDLPLTLIDGPQLQTLIQSVQRHPSPALATPHSQPSVIRDQKSETPSVPSCPRCQSPMTQRTAKRGAHAGQQIWGCSTYPKCKGTRTI
jgi:restriction system protein